jgi:site-specific recombinase XerD
MLNESRLFQLVHDFLLVYLPQRRNYSDHTAKSYRVALDQLIDFIKARRNISIDKVTFEMLTADALNAWLDSLEAERGCSISTRNQRRASIGAFLKYAAAVDVTTVMFRKEMKKVPTKKTNQVELIKHMSETAISVLLETPDAATPTGLRDRLFLLLMYDTAARCQEMLGLHIKDLRLGEAPAALLHGKGNKIRSVPIRPKTVLHLREYLNAFHSSESEYSEQFLFYSILHGAKRKLSASWARKTVAMYGIAARKACLEVPENVHCHLLRHSRAMHLYQRGMPLALLAQLLGHSHLETALGYAHADTEHKRQAIAAASTQNDLLSKKLNAERFVVSDEEQLKILCGLRQARR